jgi:type IX secretion system PorP/SprF family membrane protein
MKHIKIYLVIIFILMEVTLRAQREPIYSQYIFNNSVINPAHAGASDSNQVGLMIRNQWAGMDGAPKTITAYANIRLPKQLGLAVSIYQDKLGPEVDLQIQTDLAYHVRLSEEWYLASGIRFIASYLRVGLTDVPNVDPGNPYFTVDISSRLKINTGVGLLAYSSNYFFGIAVPETFRTKISISEPGVFDFKKKEIRSLFTYGGSNIQLSEEFIFTPSVMIRLGKIPTQVDLNTIFGYKNILDFGPMITTNLTQLDNWFNSVGFLIGVRYWKNWYFGYIYEFPPNQLRYATSQTHEISLKYLWDNKRTRNIRLPKYFLE